MQACTPFYPILYHIGINCLSIKAIFKFSYFFGLFFLPLVTLLYLFMAFPSRMYSKNFVPVFICVLHTFRRPLGDSEALQLQPFKEILPDWHTYKKRNFIGFRFSDWATRIRTLKVTESESVALPFGDSPSIYQEELHRIFLLILKSFVTTRAQSYTPYQSLSGWQKTFIRKVSFQRSFSVFPTEA